MRPHLYIVVPTEFPLDDEFALQNLATRLAAIVANHKTAIGYLPQSRELREFTKWLATQINEEVFRTRGSTSSVELYMCEPLTVDFIVKELGDQRLLHHEIIVIADSCEEARDLLRDLGATFDYSENFSLLRVVNGEVAVGEY